MQELMITGKNKNTRIKQLSLKLVLLILAASPSKTSGDSNQITYIKNDLFEVFRYHTLHVLKIPSFVVKVDSLEKSNDKFKLKIFIKNSMYLNGQFYDSDQAAYPLNMNSYNETHYAFERQGSHEEINLFLSQFFYKKTDRFDKDQSVKVIFEIENYNGEKEVLEREVVLAEKIKTQILADENLIKIKPGQSFSKNIAIVMERDNIIKNIQTKLSSNLGTRFLKAELKKSVLVLSGETPGNSGDGDFGDRLECHIYLYDYISNDTSESFTYTLVIEKPDSSAEFTLIFAVLIVSMFSLMVIACLVILLKKETRREKEQIRTHIQKDSKVERNILTKSILEWRGGAKIDQNTSSSSMEKSKNSVLFNPYDKYSLKKPKKQSYDTLTKNSKNYDMDTDRDIELSPKKPQEDAPEKMLDGLKNSHDISALNFSRAFGNNDRTLADFGNLSNIGKLPSIILPRGKDGVIEEADGDLINDSGKILEGL